MKCHCQGVLGLHDAYAWHRATGVVVSRSMTQSFDCAAAAAAAVPAPASVVALR